MITREAPPAGRDEIDAAVDELLRPFHAFVVATVAARDACHEPYRLESDHELKRATTDLRAAFKRFADTLRT